MLINIIFFNLYVSLFLKDIHYKISNFFSYYRDIVVVLHFFGHSLKLFIFPKSFINTIKTEHRYLPSKTKSTNSPSYNFLYYSDIGVSVCSHKNVGKPLTCITEIYGYLSFPIFESFITVL